MVGTEGSLMKNYKRRNYVFLMIKPPLNIILQQSFRNQTQYKRNIFRMLLFL